MMKTGILIGLLLLAFCFVSFSMLTQEPATTLIEYMIGAEQ